MTGANYKLLPEKLKVGDHIACSKHYDHPEVLEVLTVYDDGRILLCRENGDRALIPLEMGTLRAYDYELLEEEPK